MSTCVYTERKETRMCRLWTCACPSTSSALVANLRMGTEELQKNSYSDMQLYIHKCVRRTTINIMTNRLHTNRPFESMLLHLLTDEPIEQCRNKSGTGTGLCTWKRWTDVGNKWLELRQLRVITYVIEHMYAARSVASFSIPPPRMHSGKHKS